MLVEFNQDGDRGYAARTRAIARATGTHLAFIDDDDCFAPGAFGTFTQHACDKPVICQMQYRGGSVLWKVPRIGYGNVGTPMFLVPNIPEKLGKWEGWGDADSGGDCTFIHGCVRAMGDPLFIEKVVAYVDPL